VKSRSIRSSRLPKLALTLGLVAAAAGLAAAPALADPYDWHHDRRVVREHEAREHAWREHERIEHRGYAYVPPRPAYVAPGYAYAPPAALNFVFPFTLR
jgi:hypothetical protein